MSIAAEIPTAHTPPGGYGAEMPPPILSGCTELLVDGAPDLRGLWEVLSVEVRGQPMPAHPLIGNRQRIEQAGDRLVVTGGGVIHDMRCDGTVENGVHDVMGADFTTEITVTASYEKGVHVLRPQQLGETASVTRELDGEQMIWNYAGRFVARLSRVGDVA